MRHPSRFGLSRVGVRASLPSMRLTRHWMSCRILYDRLQSTVAPTNPYALSSAAHLASLASSSSAASTSSNPNAPPSILAPPSYPLADPAAPELFLRQLDAQKLAALDQPGAAASHVEYGERPVDGIAGEGDAAKEHRALMAAGGPVNGQANGGGGNAVQAAMQAAADAAAAAAGSSGDVAASSAAVPQAVELAQAQAQAQQMQVDEA